MKLTVTLLATVFVLCVLFDAAQCRKKKHSSEEKKSKSDEKTQEDDKSKSEEDESKSKEEENKSEEKKSKSTEEEESKSKEEEKSKSKEDESKSKESQSKSKSESKEHESKSKEDDKSKSKSDESESKEDKSKSKEDKSKSKESSKSEDKSKKSKKVRCGKPPVKPLVGIDKDGKLAPSFEEGLTSPSSDRIVGGIVAKPHSTPWQVQFHAHAPHNDAAAFINMCSGSLISRNWIVSAAHCFDMIPNKNMTYEIAVGFFDSYLDKKTQTCVIKREDVHLHPDGKPGTDPYQYIDVALLNVTHCGFKYNKWVQPVCLPKTGDDFRKDVGTYLLVSGWGAEDQDDVMGTTKLKQAVMPITDWNKCRDAYEDISDTLKSDKEGGGYEVFASTRVLSYYFCSNAKGKDACQGDSGGPAVTLDDNGRFVLAGIVHSGYGCGNYAYPGLYLNVPLAVPWIKMVIGGADMGY